MRALFFFFAMAMGFGIALGPSVGSADVPDRTASMATYAGTVVIDGASYRIVSDDPRSTIIEKFAERGYHAESLTSQFGTLNIRITGTPKVSWVDGGYKVRFQRDEKYLYMQLYVPPK